MQISVAPKSTASCTRRTNSSRSISYASGERLPWPKPQNAQPTTHTFETLMLRFTTNVTVSPASSSRSSSAAWRISSIASGRVSANIAVSSSGVSATPSLPRSTAPPTRLGRGGVGDVRGLSAVVALVRHEVLQDHLLDVPVLAVDRRQRLERLDALLLALADPHEDPA